MAETPGFRARVLLFGLIAVIFLAVLGTALSAEFYVIEDHLLVVGREWGLSQWMTRIAQDIEAFQRVRPAYWLYIAAGDQVLGTNAHTWHAVTLGWGVLTTYLFAVSLRRLGVIWFAIGVFVLVMLLGGTQNWIWVSLIPQETTGMGMSAIAVWAIVLRTSGNQGAWWDGVALLAMTIAGLVKESFIILIPALLLLRVTLSVHSGGRTWMAAAREARWALVGGMIVLGTQLGFVVAIVVSQPAGYSATASGMSLASLTPARFLRTIASAGAAEAATAAVLGAFACLALWFDRNVRRSIVIAAVAIAGLWVGPQLVLYSNGLTGRYLFPSVAGVAGLIALALSVLLLRPRLRVVGWIATLMMLPYFGKGLSATTVALTSFTAETVSTARAIRFVAENVPSTEAVLIATDSGTGYGFESTHSVPMYAGLAGSRSAFHLWPLFSRGPRSALHIAASKDNTGFKYPDSMVARDVGAILIMDRGIPSFDPQALNTWLAGTSWREISFSEPYYTWSWSAPLRQRIGAVTQRMLLQSHGNVPGARPLVRVDDELQGSVSVAPFLDLPPWGLEVNGSLVWIGHGDDESVGGVLAAETATRVELVCDIQPGPSLPGARRTVELVLENGTALEVQRVAFDGTEWRFSVPLQSGANRFRLRVVDAPTVRVQPNGDTRNLMALLSQLAIRPAR